MPESKEPLPEEPTPEEIKRQKLTMGVIVASLLALVASIDVFAFQNGAFATISQTWLTLNQRCWFLTYLFAAICGALLQHVAVARDPGHISDPGFVRQMLLWTPAFWVGVWVSYSWLWQLPGQD